MLDRLVQALPPLPRPSDLVRPELKWESLGTVLRELAPLARRHHAEVSGKGAFDPDWDRFLSLELIGVMHLLTARDAGMMVGYVFVYVAPNMTFSSTLWANIADQYLDPLYRVGWTANAMLDEAERKATELGAKVFDFNEHLGYRNARGLGIGVLLKRRGYEERETIWSKRLET